MEGTHKSWEFFAGIMFGFHFLLLSLSSIFDWTWVYRIQNNSYFVFLKTHTFRKWILKIKKKGSNFMCGFTFTTIVIDILHSHSHIRTFCFLPLFPIHRFFDVRSMKRLMRLYLHIYLSSMNRPKVKRPNNNSNKNDNKFISKKTQAFLFSRIKWIKRANNLL